jgi:hypothetical protein
MPAAERGLVVAAGSRHHGGAECLGELDGGQSDAARSAVHEKPFAADELRAVEHVVPYREVVLGNSRSLLERPAGRNRQAPRRRCGAVLGVAATRSQRADAVADVPSGGVRTERDDSPGDFETQYRRCVGRRRIRSGALRTVGTIHACVGDFDEYVVRPGLRRGALCNVHHTGRASRLDCNVAHVGRNRHLRAPRSKRRFYVRSACGCRRMGRR